MASNLANAEISGYSGATHNGVKPPIFRASRDFAIMAASMMEVLKSPSFAMGPRVASRKTKMLSGFISERGSIQPHRGWNITKVILQREERNYVEAILPP